MAVKPARASLTGKRRLARAFLPLDAYLSLANACLVGLSQRQTPAWRALLQVASDARQFAAAMAAFEQNAAITEAFFLHNIN